MVRDPQTREDLAEAIEKLTRLLDAVQVELKDDKDQDDDGERDEEAGRE